MKQKGFIQIIALILAAGALIVAGVVANRQKGTSFGDAIGLLPPIKQSGNALLPRVATFDFGLGNATATSSAPFSWDTGPNILTLANLTVTGTCTGCGGGGSSTNYKGLSVREGLGAFTHVGSLSFDANMFDISYLTASQAYARLDWTNGPASRSAVNTWSAVNTFSAGASVSGQLEVNGIASISGALTVGGNETVTGTITDLSIGSDSFSGSIDVLKGIRGVDITSSGRFIGLGVGSSSFLGSLNLSKSLTVSTTGTFSGGGSSSFAGSLNVTKSITSGGLTISSLNLTNTGSTSFPGSLNLSKSLTVTNSITGATFQGSGAGSSSFAGSLNLSKGLHASGDVTTAGRLIETGAASDSFAGSLNLTKSLTVTNSATAATFQGSGVGSSSFAGSLNLSKGLHATGNLTTAGVLIDTGAGSSSFTGSLNTTLSITSAKSVTATQFQGSGASSNSFAGSLNLTKSITVTNSVTGATFQGSGAGSSSFAGSLNLTKSLTVTNSATAASFQGSGTGSSSFAGSLKISKSLNANSFQGGGLGAACTGTSFWQSTTPGQFNCTAAPAAGSLSSQAGVAATEVMFFQSSSVASGALSFQWDTANKFLGVGSSSPQAYLSVKGKSGGIAPIVAVASASGTNVLTINKSGNAIFGGTGSNTFAGSLDLTKSLTSSKTVTATAFQGSGAGSSSFAGSLNLTKSLTVTNSVTGATFQGSGAGSSSFAGSLNLTKSATVTNSVTAGSFQGSGTGSSSFAGSLNLSKGITAAKWTGAFTATALASHSFTGSLAGPATKTLSVGTSNNLLKVLWADIVQVVTSIFVPTTTSTATTLTASGSVAINTASRSLDFGDGTNQNIIQSRVCFTYQPTVTSKLQIPGKRFLDPFTLTDVAPVASGNNSVTWNLKSGVPGTVTTNVFTTDHQASNSSYPVYKTSGLGAINTAAVPDGQMLDFVITSASSTVKLSVTVCGRYTK